MPVIVTEIRASAGASPNFSTTGIGIECEFTSQSALCATDDAVGLAGAGCDWSVVHPDSATEATMVAPATVLSLAVCMCSPSSK
jgi:hypothetical protein